MRVKNRPSRGMKRLLAGVTTTGMVFAFMAASPAMAGVEQNVRTGGDHACVFSRSVYDWQALDPTNLVIWAPRYQEAYHVKLGFPLHDLTSQIGVAFVDRNRDGMLCGNGRDQVVTTGGLRERATILGMTRLDEAGLAALAEQYNVKLGPKATEQPED